MDVLVIVPNPHGLLIHVEGFYKLFELLCPVGVFPRLLTSDSLDPDCIERNLLTAKKVNAVVLLDPPPDFAMIRRVFLSGCPCITVCLPSAVPEELTVTLDVASAAQMAVTLLLNQGHRNIALLESESDPDFALACEAGYRQAFANLSIPSISHLVRPAARAEVGAYWETMELFSPSAPAQVSALVASDTMTALGAEAALRSLQLSVPDEVSLVTLEAPAFAELHSSSITSVGFNTENTVQQVMNAVMASVSGKTLPCHVIRPQLFFRQSTARVCATAHSQK